MTKTFTLKGGTEVRSEYSDMEALQICKEADVRSKFILGLLEYHKNYGKLSEKQWAYIHKYAVEKRAKEEKVTGVDYKGIEKTVEKLKKERYERLRGREREREEKIKRDREKTARFAEAYRAREKRVDKGLATPSSATVYIAKPFVEFQGNLTDLDFREIIFDVSGLPVKLSWSLTSVNVASGVSGADYDEFYCRITRNGSGGIEITWSKYDKGVDDFLVLLVNDPYLVFTDFPKF